MKGKRKLEGNLKIGIRRNLNVSKLMFRERLKVSIKKKRHTNYMRIQKDNEMKNLQTKIYSSKKKKTKIHEIKR